MAADEDARRAIYLAQRARRVEAVRERELAMAGDPIAAAAVRQAFLPLELAALQRQVPEPLDDGPEGVVVNDNLNL